jgi:hypothetical protein
MNRLTRIRRLYSTISKKEQIPSDTFSDHATIFTLSTLFAGAFGYATYLVYRKLENQFYSHSWPHTKGLIEYVTFTTGRSSGIQNPVPSFIEYSYRIGINTYKGHTVTNRLLPPLLGTQLERVEIKESTGKLSDYPLVRPLYRQGNHVTVFYDPKSPSQSCLEPSASLAYEDIALGTLLAMITLLFASGTAKRTVGLARTFRKRNK